MKTTLLQKVAAQDLQPGQLIDPPAGEKKKWLWVDGRKPRYTIKSIQRGKKTAKGQFIKVNATVDLPHRPEPWPIDCQILSTKLVIIRG